MPPRFQNNSSKGNTRKGAGNGSRGGKHQAKDPQPCRLFSQGRCHYGNRCSYKHDQSSTSSTKQSTAAPTTEEILDREAHRDWKRGLKRFPDLDLYPRSAMTEIWNGALEILARDNRNLQQQVVRDLVEEETHGLSWVKEVMNMRDSTLQTGSSFLTVVRPFLKLITHPALLDCLSVDTYVGDLYSFMAGSGGTRVIPFFANVCQSLNRENPVDVDEPLACLVRALREVVIRNQKMLYHEDLPGLINSILQLCSAPNTKDRPGMIATNTRIAELQRLIQRTSTTLGDGTETNATDVTGAVQALARPAYPQGLELPGSRHDNDKENIAQIKIIPTEKEIRCEKGDFLPSCNFETPYFLEGVERLIDIHFRLLRHDIFEEVKKTIAELLHVHDNKLGVDQWFRSSMANKSINTYDRATVRRIEFTKQRGLEAQVSFLEPRQIMKQTKAQKQQWWCNTRRLDEGCLLCLVCFHAGKSSTLFLTVSQKVVTPGQQASLVPDRGRMATTTVSLIPGQATSDLEILARQYHLPNDENNILIEFPRILLGTFVPILENLQQMYRESRLPFLSWIVPNTQGIVGGVAKRATGDVPPPVYSRVPGFSLKLDSILNDKSASLSLSPASVQPEVRSKLKEFTSLDDGQCNALIAALAQELCLIQGPPGTGKSYLGVQLMRVLVANQAQAQLGPIVVVCYTNHALDQFLEHLLSVGIGNIIRIGSQSSSDAMEQKNLRALTRSMSKTRSEDYTLGKSHSEREKKEKHLQAGLSALHHLKNKDWRGFDFHLRRMYPEIHRQFCGKDSEGFVMKTKKGDPFNMWIQGRGGSPSKSAGEKKSSHLNYKGVLKIAKQDVWSLSRKERIVLVDNLVREIREKIIDSILDDFHQDDLLSRQIRDVYDEVDRRVLATAEVIGVTTSGLARRIPVLRRIRSKVVICEEAGEVLEAHMLSALIPSVEHLIQIGDHQQLRPQIVNHKLSMESHSGGIYQLDRSQFERLSVGEYGLPALPTAQLNVQRRMRPDISQLVRNTLYDRLTDHDSVNALPNVVGMRANVYWFDHQQHEDDADSEIRGRSKSNTWEVGMTHALVRHIVRQGVYRSDEIAVLTPYVGQLQKLRAALQADFEIVLSDRDEEKLVQEGHTEAIAPAKNVRLAKKSINELLRIATVDNFQGEEAKVIIISLVRSNKSNKVGFLKTSNRINVLLSRAQHGMYLIGNSQTYSNISMWSEVLDMLKSGGSFGPALALRCERHPETEIAVCNPEDFELSSPQGGCRKECSDRLPRCGHQCRSKCHSEALHRAFRCPLPCERLFDPCSHECPGLCGDPCGPCKTVVRNIKLPCGHVEDRLLCHETQDLKRVACQVKVKKTVSGCGHTVSVSCSQNVTSPSFTCTEPCIKVLACGHKCSGTCGRCTPRKEEGAPITTSHQKCKVTCGRKYGSCYHHCPRPCHNSEECGLCMAPCEVQCAHSKCSRKCHEACAPCVERCTWACEHHTKCTLPCAAPCNRMPCSKRCTETLECGHQCPGLCGERCPTEYCQVCSGKGDARVDMLELKSYDEVDLDESPIVVLGCGHFFTAETLDGHVGMRKVYKVDQNGEFLALSHAEDFSQFVPRCPDCQSPIQQYATQRYNRVINQAVLDETSRRFIISGTARLQGFASHIQDLDDKYLELKEKAARTRQPGERPMPELLPENLFKPVTHQRDALTRAIKSFIEEVCGREQPVRKLYDATVKAMRSQSVEERMSNISIHDQIPRLSPDLRIVAGGQAILLKLEYVNLKNRLEWEKKNGCNSSAFDNELTLAKKFLESCESTLDTSVIEDFPRLGVEVRLYHAGIAYLYNACSRSSSVHDDASKLEAQSHVKKAKEYLDEATRLCMKEFPGADKMRIAIEESKRVLGKEWYEEVTKEELDAIKLAMVSGSGGIASHSGHWYNCENGHPFAIGECGMPMELARCPECGARVGGEHHRPAAGVSRAVQME